MSGISHVFINLKFFIHLSEKGTVMRVMMFDTIRGVVTEANDRGIKREQVVAFFRDVDKYVLVYYEE